MKLYMEHINISVADLSAAVSFFQTAFPEFKIRGEGDRESGGWVHVGTDETYVALTEVAVPFGQNRDYDRTGFNHVGFVVEDVKALAERLLGAGFKRSYPIQLQRFRIRDYFLDAEGNEYEFVQYLSAIVAERNDYGD